MNSEIIVEDQLVEKTLKEQEDGLFERTRIEEKQENQKKAFAKAVSVSDQTQRLYFVVRSTIMSVLGAIMTFAIVWHLRTIDVMEDSVLGISTYVICLALSRLFDKRITDISKRIILHLGEHTRIRDFIVKNF